MKAFENESRGLCKRNLKPPEEWGSEGQQRGRRVTSCRGKENGVSLEERAESGGGGGRGNYNDFREGPSQSKVMTMECPSDITSLGWEIMA